MWREPIDDRRGAVPTMRKDGDDVIMECAIVRVFARDGLVVPQRGRLVLRCADDGTITARLTVESRWRP